MHITFKELVPEVMAITLWGHQWWGSMVKCWSDNATVVSSVKSSWSDKELTMHLMLTLIFYTA